MRYWMVVRREIRTGREYIYPWPFLLDSGITGDALIGLLEDAQYRIKDHSVAVRVVLVEIHECSMEESNVRL